MKKTREPAMPKTKFVSLQADRTAINVIEDVASLEGRPKTQMMDTIFRRFAQLYKRDPDKLLELGFITPLSVPQHAAA